VERPVNESEAQNIETVRRYYDGCNAGDIEEMMRATSRR
jgi:hypothetical protein